ncbi:hypothetical protein J2S98_001723 [Arthrobacter oryzae]|nr:hypothetical protein [Arthrobacter oryzae]
MDPGLLRHYPNWDFALLGALVAVLAGLHSGNCRDPGWEDDAMGR